MRGELRHETCRWGTLTETHLYSAVGGWKPSVRPLCTFTAPIPLPPPLLRAWGGDVEPNRDCVSCPVWALIEMEKTQ